MPHVNEENSRPLYVVVAGTAVASVGLSVSILAACIQWLLPDLAAVAPARGVKPGPQPRRRKAHRRRSSLPVNLTPMQIAPTPRSRHRHSIAVAPSLPQTPIHNPNRRVYFADSPRSVTFQLPVSEESSPLPAVFNPIANCNLSGSPESSSSTLVCATTSPPANRRISQIKEGVEPTLDSGPLAKRFPPLRLPKFMDVKRRRVSSREENSSNVVPVDSNDAAPADLFGPISRTSTYSEGSSDDAPSSQPQSLISILNHSPTTRILSLPVIPRSSSPVRPARTQPYDYPYYASPPRRSSSQREALKPVPPDNKRSRSYPVGVEGKAS